MRRQFIFSIVFIYLCVSSLVFANSSVTEKLEAYLAYLLEKNIIGNTELERISSNADKNFFENPIDKQKKSVSSLALLHYEQFEDYLYESYDFSELKSWVEVTLEKRQVDRNDREQKKKDTKHLWKKRVPSIIGAGNKYSCVLKVDGKGRCWGSNKEEVSTAPSNLSPYQELSSGSGHNCAIKVNGIVQCWGSNYYGQSTPPHSLGPVQQVSAGEFHTCAIKINNFVQCWGGKYGDSESVPPEDLGAILQIAAGHECSCVIKFDSYVQCWGKCPNVPSHLGQVLQISVRATYDYEDGYNGDFYACAIKIDGYVQCWGNDYFGHNTPPSDLGPVLHIVTGGRHACVIDGEEKVRCWGQNKYGQASPPKGLGRVVQLAAGEDHTCAIDAVGIVHCWGNDHKQQSKVPRNLKVLLLGPSK